MAGKAKLLAESTTVPSTIVEMTTFEVAARDPGFVKELTEHDIVGLEDRDHTRLGPPVEIVTTLEIKVAEKEE